MAKNNLFIIAAGSLLALPVLAVDLVTLRLGQIAGADWKAETVNLTIDWKVGPEVSFILSADSITHPALPLPLKAPVVSCTRGVVSDQQISCQKGMLLLQHPDLDKPEVPLSFHWEKGSGLLQVTLQEMRFAEGVLKIEIQSQGQDWSINAKGKDLDIQKARQRLASYLPAGDGLELAGKVSLTASVSGVGDSPSRLKWQVGFDDATFSDNSGEYLGEGLVGHWQGALSATAERWKGDSQLKLKEGAILTPFAYLGPEGNPISISTRLGFDQHRLELTSLNFQHPEIIELDLMATLVLGAEPAVESLKLRTKPLDIQAVYAAYMQPVLAESLLANLEWSGEAEALLDYTPKGAQRLELHLRDVHIDEALSSDEVEEVAQRRHFGLYGLNGKLVWTQGQSPEASSLTWESGHLLEGITLGATDLDLQLHEESVRLIHSAGIPVLDGRLEVQVFDLFLEEAGSRIEFGGALTPISMEAFSQAMGWMPLSGKLSGGIPGATYQNGVLTIDGAMVANIFDGWIVISDLRLEDLFGVWPMLSVNLELKNLDLEVLSSTFSFGKITGKLEGRMDDLYLENWKPVSFDARFATPESDDSRHRISQRAVDNISNLGGSGVSGALSRSLLGFFDEFGYDRLGISCRLENGVCEMDGVEQARQGYYLVKGGGIPRIDILGFNRRIDWELLIAKLQDIIESGAGEARVE